MCNEQNIDVNNLIHLNKIKCNYGFRISLQFFVIDATATDLNSFLL